MDANMTSPIVTVQEGQLRGKLDKDFLGGTFYSFLGIPYGKAPVGELRFKTPLPVEPWEGIRDATSEGPECPSRHMMFTYFTGSEDNCLNLNVFTPELPTHDCTSLKPVMVWIHGGGFMHGSNKSDLYGPDYLITENIVLVCINYRTGVFGFLSLEDPSLGVPGNTGLKDMVLALKWVQKNIKSFCGDANNVTIFGESAGSAAVQYLLLSPLSKGLFHKAIAQSGSALNCWAKGCTNGLIIADKLEYQETDEKKILEYLRSLPPHKIVEGQHKLVDLFSPSTIRPFGPVVEKTSAEPAFLSEEPLEIIKSGKFNHVPLIMGYNSREGILIEAVKMIQRGVKISTNIENEIFYDLKLPAGSQKSVEMGTKIKNFYFGEEEYSDKKLNEFYLLRTDAMFLYGIHKSISLQKLESNSPIYFYRMTLDTPQNLFKTVCISKNPYILMICYFLIHKSGDGLIKKLFLRLAQLIPTKQVSGTSHADDLAYLFKTFVAENPQPGSLEEMYIQRFVRLWANFAKTGNPTPDKDDSLLKVHWNPVTKEENCLLNIDTELQMETDPDSERIQFWKNICG